MELVDWIHIILYWLPLSICVVGYTWRTAENYHKDIVLRDKFIKYQAKRKELKDDVDALIEFNKEVKMKEGILLLYYSPTDTIGTIIVRALVSIIPVANLLAVIFDVAPCLFCKLIDRIKKIFDFPLVTVPKDF